MDINQNNYYIKPVNFLKIKSDSPSRFFAITRKQFLDYITNTVSSHTETEELNNLFLKRKDEIQIKLTAIDKEKIVSLYFEYYLKNKRADFDFENPDKCDWNLCCFSDKNLKNKEEIIHNYITTKSKEGIELNQWGSPTLINQYNYSSQIEALKLLQYFDFYSQNIISINTADSKMKAVISFVTKNNKQEYIAEIEFESNEGVRTIELKEEFDENGFLIENSEKLDRLVSDDSFDETYFIKIKDIYYFNKFIVTQVKCLIEVPILSKQEFVDFKFKKEIINRIHYKGSFNFTIPYFNEFSFEDIKGNKCKIALWQHFIILAENKTNLKGAIPNELIPVHQIPIFEIILSELKEQDFSDIDSFYLNDKESSIGNFKNLQNQMGFIKQEFVFFLYGRVGTGTGYEKYKIFKVVHNLEKNKTTINFLSFGHITWTPSMDEI